MTEEEIIHVFLILELADLDGSAALGRRACSDPAAAINAYSSLTAD